MKRTALKLGALVALTAVSACAATITFSDSQSTSFTPSTLTFNLSQFNPSLGALQSVTIIYAAVVNGSLSVTNNSLQNGELTGTMSGDFSLNGPGSLGTLINLTPSTSLGPTPVAASSTVLLDTLSASDFGFTVLTNPADLALFMGIGSVSLSGDAHALSSPVVNFTPVLIQALLSGAAEVTVVYEYAGVPEPSSVVLFASGIALVLCGIYRRRSSSTL